MATVREVCGLLKESQKIVIGYGEGAVPLDKNDMLMMAAYGDFMVQSIIGDADGYFEINVLMQPVKGGVA